MKGSRSAPGDRVTVLVAHPGSELYGSDRMVLESVRGLADAGAQVVVALPSSGPLSDTLTAEGVEVVVVPMPVLRKVALRPSGFLRLITDAARAVPPSARLLRRVRPDVVYVSTLTIPTWLLHGRLVRARTVCHVHEAEQHQVRLVTLALIAPLALAHRLVVNSRFSASVIITAIPRLRCRVEVVPNGVAGPVSPRPPRPDLDGRLSALLPGRISPRKGTHVGVAALRHASPGVSLHVLGSVFAGYEWFEDELREEAADLLADGTLRMTPFSSDVWDHLAEADVVLVPSVSPEPFGNTAVEALLAGRPVIVSDTGGLPEAVAGSPAALRVPPSDAEALARALEDVRGRWPELSRAAWTDRERVVESFAPLRYRSRIAALCLGSGRSTPTVVDDDERARPRTTEEPRALAPPQ